LDLCPILSGPPARFGFLEAGAAIDQGRLARAARALSVRGLLVDLEGRGIERDAVVFQGAADGDEAARDVLADTHGVAGERIAPVPPRW
jgi:hypothetical protein